VYLYSSIIVDDVAKAKKLERFMEEAEHTIKLDEEKAARKERLRLKYKLELE